MPVRARRPGVRPARLPGRATGAWPSAAGSCSTACGAPDWVGDERTVDVHVRQLRKKLGDALPLATVWGVGLPARLSRVTPPPRPRHHRHWCWPRLVLAGLGTLPGRHAAREADTEDRAQPSGRATLAAGAAACRPPAAAVAAAAGALEQLESVGPLASRLDGIGLLHRAAATASRAGDLPVAVAAADLDLEARAAGETVSGAAGDLVYAAAPAERTGVGTLVVVLTREQAPAPGRRLPVVPASPPGSPSLVGGRGGRRLGPRGWCARSVAGRGGATRPHRRRRPGARLPEPAGRAPTTSWPS